MFFLDTSPVIYFIEQTPVWGMKATAKIGTFLTTGDRLAVSDLVRMECQVGPLKFATFFASPDVQVLPISALVCDRAAQIRAQHGFKPLDSLHLAAAKEFACNRFLTNDNRLSKFPDLTVEVLS
jgi:predicted nucleic acid-binding protein